MKPLRCGQAGVPSCYGIKKENKPKQTLKVSLGSKQLCVTVFCCPWLQHRASPQRSDFRPGYRHTALSLATWDTFHTIFLSSSSFRVFLRSCALRCFTSPLLSTRKREPTLRDVTCTSGACGFLHARYSEQEWVMKERKETLLCSGRRRGGGQKKEK